MQHRIHICLQQTTDLRQLCPECIGQRKVRRWRDRRKILRKNHRAHMGYELLELFYCWYVHNTDKYRSPVSGSRATIILPLFSELMVYHLSSSARKSRKSTTFFSYTQTIPNFFSEQFTNLALLFAHVEKLQYLCATIAHSKQKTQNIITNIQYESKQQICHHHQPRVR